MGQADSMRLDEARSLLGVTAASDLDLIVVDNDGGLQTSGLAARLEGAVVLEPKENLGFVRGANAGAERS